MSSLEALNFASRYHPLKRMRHGSAALYPRRPRMEDIR
jgi:hypothetical protein